MAQIPRAALDYVTEQINGLSADAQAKVLKVLQALDWKPDEADNVAACRQAVVDALASIMPTYTDAAAQASADFYDASRTLVVGEPLGAHAISGYDPRKTEGAVRSFVRFILEDRVETFNDQVLQRIDYEMKRAANVSMAENTARDPLRPRYARVPTGLETCEFCLMLSSRGFDYTSAEAASHAHAFCDCRVVAGFDGIEVEGYDPDALYSDYLDGKFGTFKSKKKDRTRLNAVSTLPHREFGSVGEMASYLSESTDLETLYSRGDEVQAALGVWFKDKENRDKYLAMVRQAASRRHGELTSSGSRGIVTYTKPRSELKLHEARGVDRLSGLGKDVETIPEIGDASAYLDVLVAGEEAEMKNVTNAGSSVGNQIGRIREKFWKVGKPGQAVGVVTAFDCSDSFEEVVIAVEQRKGYKKMIVLDEENVAEIEK